MAAGNATRCVGDPKQLLRLPDGSTVLGRLVDQISSRGSVPLLVTHRISIAQEYQNFIVPHNHKTLCDSILSTDDYWSDTNLFILGDVVFTEKGINMAMSMTGDVMVLGNENEIYAMQFNLSDRREVKKALSQGAGYGLGKLRYFYKAYTRLPMGGSEVEKCHMTWLRDETNDIDSLEEYESIMRKWNVAGNQPGY